MLDDFMNDQPIAYKILKNSIISNKVSHAYIIESNGYSKSFDLALSFAKYLLCPKSYTNNSKCEDCGQCTSINNNEYIELKIIEADGQWIKKSQLDELQLDFSKKAVLGDKKIYIIHYPKGIEVKYSVGPIINRKENRIGYRCETEEGSSGAPIFNLNNFNVIGIHRGAGIEQNIM